ncbi:D-erythronate kinase [Moorella thermoacetica]|uniref:D-erythronate kinase n=1 Tax=Neomoorella thermoacetica TaxID=1525 RepID=A0AAC9MTI6_NEOTH|nr:four-carbon acid sugar kinase family protein [Moorella thermoacetica]AOQ22740.1 hypothetical protein Maut_00257 [Moorella thermoacetica]TYL06833.1 D-erythronate kinase [Moorella thermoacetica]
MALIGAVADDLTGATTVGVLLARAGAKTAALFRTRELDAEDLLDYQAIVLSTDSRALSKEEAMQRVKSATLTLKKMGVKQFSKRIDTTLRGGIGAEIEAMLEELPAGTIAVMVPAMPQSNRIMVGGYSLINGVPLSMTPVAHDVRTPVRDSFVPRLIARQTSRQVGHISLDELLKGKDNLKKVFIKLRETGNEILLVDAISLEDVEMIAETVIELNWNVLAIDPGPFTERLAKVRGWVKCRVPSVPLREKPEPSDKGTVIVIAGSASPVTISQMKALQELPGTHTVSVTASYLVPGGKLAAAEVEKVVRSILEALRQETPPRVVLIETAISGQVLNLDEEDQRYGMPSGQAANNISQGLGKIARKVLDQVADKITGLYLTGGDIMVNVCAELEARGIELLDYVIPQADQGKLIGGKFHGFPVIGKGGLTGDLKTAIFCVNRLFDIRKGL